MILTMPDTMVMLILRENDVIKVKKSKIQCTPIIFFNFKFIRDLIYSTHLLTLSMTPAYTAPAEKYGESAQFLINLNEIA